MYRKKSPQMTIDDFFLPFGGKLDAYNRWVKYAAIIPWDDFEDEYARNFKEEGPPAKPLRMALGALIIKEKCGYSDEETVQQIRENPYLQYFIGLKSFQTEPPFDPSLMTHFRKRLNFNIITSVNESITERGKKSKDDHKDDDPPAGRTPSHELDNKGKLILDATCAPADIEYPTDLNLLNQAREKLDAIIDTLHFPFRGLKKRPRTYRHVARRKYLIVAKNKRPSAKILRKAIGQQLGYVARNLRAVERLLQTPGHGELTKRQVRLLETIKELYAQQRAMYENKKHSIPNRIVSLSQPWVRPIVRGKAKDKTEFGAKIAISLVNGYATIERLSWDNFNEGTDLIASVERYKERFGYYPEAVMADKLYRNRANLTYCKKLGIRLSGPPLGRPKASEKKSQIAQEKEDARIRNAVEGKFGEGKRCYGLARITARLKETSETVIAIQFLVMNLEHRLRVLFILIYKRLFGKNPAPLFCAVGMKIG